MLFLCFEEHLKSASGRKVLCKHEILLCSQQQRCTDKESTILFQIKALSFYCSKNLCTCVVIQESTWKVRVALTAIRTTRTVYPSVFTGGTGVFLKWWIVISLVLWIGHIWTASLADTACYWRNAASSPWQLCQSRKLSQFWCGTASCADLVFHWQVWRLDDLFGKWIVKRANLSAFEGSPMGLIQRCQRRGWFSNTCSLGVQRIRQGSNDAETVYWIPRPGRCRRIEGKSMTEVSKFYGLDVISSCLS